MSWFDPELWTVPLIISKDILFDTGLVWILGLLFTYYLISFVLKLFKNKSHYTIKH